MSSKLKSTPSSDREYIKALERRVEVLTQGLRDAVDVLEDEKLDARAQRNALNKSDDIDAAFRWAMDSF